MSSISADTRRAEDNYEAQNDQPGGDIPAGDPGDNDYTSRTGQNQYGVPVQSDDAPVEDPISDPKVANSEEQLRECTMPLRHMKKIAWMLTTFRRA